MASLSARLAALERTAIPPPVALLFLGRTGKPDSDVIGIQSSGPRLPTDLQRLPGESLEAMKARAALLVTGPGPLLVMLRYACGTLNGLNAG